MEMIDVAIVEDDAEIRQTLALIIDGTPGFYCKRTFSACEEAIVSLPESPPDVVLMDINLPGITGIEGVKVLKEQIPKVDFIMLTIQEDDDSVFNSLLAGATGYLVKDTPPSELLDSIKEVYEGGSPMSTHIARRIVTSFKVSTHS
ncbi:MAG: response regulator, partial [Cyclobacteriaceae bacterium]